MKAEEEQINFKILIHDIDIWRAQGKSKSKIIDAEMKFIKQAEKNTVRQQKKTRHYG
jgi:hypothetical protein